MTATLRAATVRGHDVELSWADGRPVATLPLMWLRDNCPAAGSQHPDTKQRRRSTPLGIATDIQARARGSRSKSRGEC